MSAVDAVDEVDLDTGERIKRPAHPSHTKESPMGTNTVEVSVPSHHYGSLGRIGDMIIFRQNSVPTREERKLGAPDRRFGFPLGYLDGNEARRRGASGEDRADCGYGRMVAGKPYAVAVVRMGLTYLECRRACEEARERASAQEATTPPVNPRDAYSDHFLAALAAPGR